MSPEGLRKTKAREIHRTIYAANGRCESVSQQELSRASYEGIFTCGGTKRWRNGPRWHYSTFTRARDGNIRNERSSFSQPARSSRNSVRRTLPESSRKPTLVTSKLSGCL
jgi:hypothetical protein